MTEFLVEQDNRIVARWTDAAEAMRDARERARAEGKATRVIRATSSTSRNVIREFDVTVNVTERTP